MSEPDDKLQRAYRGLAREEPPASLDAAILAASRRAAAKPSFTRRWGVPVSLAAMLVLAIGVTLELQHQQPGIEVAPPASAPASAPTPTNAPAPMNAPSVSTTETMQAPEAKREAAAVPSVARPVERPRMQFVPAPAKKTKFTPSPEPAARPEFVPAPS